MWDVVLGVVGALGGGAVVVGTALHFLGKFWVGRLIQDEKAKLDMEIESHRLKLRNSEFIFEKEYEASSQFVAFFRSILPRHSEPNLDWGEVLVHIAISFHDILNYLDRFLASNGAILSDDVVGLVVDCLAISGEGQHKVDESGVSDSAKSDADLLYKKMLEIERLLLTRLRRQSLDFGDEALV